MWHSLLHAVPCVLCGCVQDYFFHKEGVNNGGNRYATVLTYLNDVEEGGETVSDIVGTSSSWLRTLFQCWHARFTSRSSSNCSCSAWSSDL